MTKWQCPICSAPLTWWLNPVTTHAEGCRIGHAEDSARAADMQHMLDTGTTQMSRPILSHEASLLLATDTTPGRVVTIHATRPTRVTRGYPPPGKEGMPAQWLRHFEFTNQEGNL